MFQQPFYNVPQSTVIGMSPFADEGTEAQCSVFQISRPPL